MKKEENSDKSSIIYFKKSFEVRWADVDPNMHMRHTAYQEYTDQTRVSLFNKYGLTFHRFRELNIGPILFGVDTRFHRELFLNEIMTINVKLLYCTADARKWGIRHQILKENGDLATTIAVDGSWIDLKQRRVATPPPEVREFYMRLEKCEDFEER